MSKYVVAVSGGVDSVVLLDLLTRQTNMELIVAHFDHGIRDDSANDARFVAELAKKYGLKFESRREELGKYASEELARDRRYDFLRSVAKKHNAKLITAHHADDVIESIAINLSRGTGWRGLAVLDSDIFRPLTHMSKSEILNYAKRHNLKWHEDSTNTSDAYLRNRIRQRLSSLDDDSKRQLLGLWMQQKSLKKQINQETANLLNSKNTYSRHFFICINPEPAMECLRHITKGLLTRPQLASLLISIKVMPAKKIYEAGNGVKIFFTPRNFTVELLK